MEPGISVVAAHADNSGRPQTAAVIVPMTTRIKYPIVNEIETSLVRIRLSKSAERFRSPGIADRAQ
jgi:hypothetical protein